MNKKLLLGMCIMIFLMFGIVSAHEYEITILEENLPYSDAKTVDLSGDINQTMNITYDSWLSGARPAC